MGPEVTGSPFSLLASYTQWSRVTIIDEGESASRELLERTAAENPEKLLLRFGPNEKLQFHF